MRNNRLAFALLILINSSTALHGQINHPDAKCLICHGKPNFSVTEVDGRVRLLYVDSTTINLSVHARWNCTDCHAVVTSIPHPAHISRVECTRCHFSGNNVGAPQGEMYDQYRESAHGLATAEGKQNAPYCQNCHGTHIIRRHTDPLSPISRLHVASTCGKCHVKEFADFDLSIHGTEVKKGNPDSPICTNCHGEHEIRMRSDPASQVNASNIPNTCSACHSSAPLMTQYGVRTKQVKTYEDSFHGIAIKFGEKQAANCASCHGVHDILPASDPKSNINVANVPHTCGVCHKDANANYARGRIHVDAEDPEAGIIYYIASFFKYLTITTLVVLIINIILDFRRKLSSKREEE